MGAAYVRWADGRRSVLTWRPHTALADLVAGPLAVTRILREGGFPAPATELTTQIGHAVAVVQELLPGGSIHEFGHDILEQALTLNAALSGRLREHTSIPLVDLHLRADGPGYCLHTPLRSHSRRSATLERWVASVGAAYPRHLSGHDAVHQDFHPGNMLAADSRITGVVDWDGAARGDRHLDLVTLRFGLHTARTAPGVVERLDEILDAVPDHVLRPSWAHMSLRMTDWAIRHFSPAEVDVWLDLAERRVD